MPALTSLCTADCTSRFLGDDKSKASIRVPLPASVSYKAKRRSRRVLPSDMNSLNAAVQYELINDADWSLLSCLDDGEWGDEGITRALTICSNVLNCIRNGTLDRRLYAGRQLVDSYDNGSLAKVLRTRSMILGKHGDIDTVDLPPPSSRKKKVK